MAAGRTFVQIATLLALLGGGGGYLFFNRDVARKELAPVVALPDDITLTDPTKVISRVVGFPIGGAPPAQPAAPATPAVEEKKPDAAAPPPATAAAPATAQPAPTPAAPKVEAKPEPQPAPAPTPAPATAQPQAQPAPAPQVAAVSAPTPPAAPQLSKTEIAERDFTAMMDRYKSGDKSVIPELERVAGDTAKPAQSVHTVAWLLAQNRQVDEAVQQFRRAASLDPRDPTIQQNLATVLAQTGRNAEAYAAVGELLKLNPEHGLGQRLKTVLEQRCGGPCK